MKPSTTDLSRLNQSNGVRAGWKAWFRMLSCPGCADFATPPVRPAHRNRRGRGRRCRAVIDRVELRSERSHTVPQQDQRLPGVLLLCDERQVKYILRQQAEAALSKSPNAWG